jgi:hypothetical protein
MRGKAGVPMRRKILREDPCLMRLETGITGVKDAGRFEDLQKFPAWELT